MYTQSSCVWRHWHTTSRKKERERERRGVLYITIIIIVRRQVKDERRWRRKKKESKSAIGSVRRLLLLLSLRNIWRIESTDPSISFRRTLVESTPDAPERKRNEVLHTARCFIVSLAVCVNGIDATRTQNRLRPDTLTYF